MKALIKYFAFFFVFLLVISTVNAFNLRQDSSSSSLCPRDTGLFVDIVRNTDSVPEDFSVNLKGSASAWSLVIPNSFVLNPNEEKKIFTYVTPSQNSNPGAYTIESIISSNDLSKTLSHYVIVKDCFKSSLKPVGSTKKESCPSAGITTFEFELFNNGEFKETFKLSVESSLNDIARLSDNSVILDKGDSKKIFLYLTAPRNADEYILNVIADGVVGKTRQSIPFILKVNPCYEFNFEVLADTSYNICDRSYVIVPFKIENRGTTINNYKIKLDGPVWSRIDRSEFSLLSNEVKNFHLALAPDYGVNGFFKVNLEASSEVGDSKFSRSVNVNVRKCHGVDVKFSDEKVNLCQSVPSSFSAVIKNTGEIRKSFKINADVPSWISFNDNLLNLDGNEEKNIIFNAIPNSNVDDKSYNIKLSVNSSDESPIFDSDELDIDVLSSEECFDPKLSLPFNDVVVYYDSSVAIPVVIENAGIKRADYSLFLSGSSAAFSNINPSEISVDPGKSETVYVYVAPRTGISLGNYDAKISLGLKSGNIFDSKSLNIEITDVKDKATDLNLVSSGPSLNNVSSASFTTKIKNWFSNLFNNDELAMNSTNLSVISFADDNVIVPVNPPIEKQSFISKNLPLFTKYKYYVIGIIILLILVFIFSSGIYRKFVNIFKDDNSINEIKNEIVDEPNILLEEASTEKETQHVVKKKKKVVKKKVSNDAIYYPKPKNKAYGVVDSPALEEFKEKIDEE